MAGACLPLVSRAVGPQAEAASRAHPLPGPRRVPRETGAAPVAPQAGTRHMRCPMRRKPVAAIVASLAAHAGGLALATAAFLANPMQPPRGGEEAIAVELVSAGDIDLSGMTQSLPPSPREATEPVPESEVPAETMTTTQVEPAETKLAALDLVKFDLPAPDDIRPVIAPAPPVTETPPVETPPPDVLATLPAPDLAIEAPEFPAAPVTVETPRAQPAESAPQKPVERKPATARPVAAKPVSRPPAPAAARSQAAPAPSSRGGSGGTTQSAGTAEIASYRARILAHLARHKTYPTAARSAGIEGRTIVSFTVTRDGNVTGVALAGASGSALLDEATLAMVRRALPFPPMPEGAPSTLTIVTAIRFDLR
jgi:protein TonB